MIRQVAHSNARPRAEQAAPPWVQGDRWVKVLAAAASEAGRLDFVDHILRIFEGYGIYVYSQ